MKSYEEAEKLRKMPDETDRIEITSLLSKAKEFLIIGDPGGGKTTLLRLIACVLAKDYAKKTKSARLKILGFSENQQTIVPIFIRLPTLAELIASGGHDIGTGASWQWIIRAIKQIFGEDNSTILESLLENRQCALLLDGLDEIPEINIRNSIAEIVNSAINKWKNNLFVISSRPFGYRDISGLEDIVTVYIDSFGEPEIISFLKKWGKGLYKKHEQKNRKAYIPELQSAIIDSPSIRLLAKNPVMLTCLCVVHWNERKLPEGKADLLAAVLRWLLNAREHNRRKRGYDNTFAEECFKTLALSMTDHKDGKKTIADLSWAAEQLEKNLLDFHNITDTNKIMRLGINFLEEEMLDSGIIEKTGVGQMRFWHLNFQEHYCARALIDRKDEDWWKIVDKHLFDKQWVEVIDHTAGCLAWTGQYRLNLLVEKTLGIIDKNKLESIAQVAGVLGRILSILKAYNYRPPARLGWQKVLNSAMEIFTIDGSKLVSPEKRITAAVALGQGGDPRIKPLEKEMIEIEKGSKVLLSKYPVTVYEFSIFIENEGYQKGNFLDFNYLKKIYKNNSLLEILEYLYQDKNFLKKFKKLTKTNVDLSSNWPEQAEHPNLPVTYICFFEAIAYCRWLSEQTKLNYRLPTNDEWNTAGICAGYLYPWGDEPPNPDLLNYDNNVGKPTPVGAYPLGATPKRHMDMLGNVWEWTSTFTEITKQVFARGASWSRPGDLCQCKYVSHFSPLDRENFIGFRLAMDLE